MEPTHRRRRQQKSKPLLFNVFATTRFGFQLVHLSPFIAEFILTWRGLKERIENHCLETIKSEKIGFEIRFLQMQQVAFQPALPSHLQLLQQAATLLPQFMGNISQ